MNWGMARCLRLRSGSVNHRSFLIRLSKESSLAVLVTDVVMPRKSGPALVREIRSFQPDLPVLYVSGYVRENEKLALDGSKTMFLQKPYTIASLLDSVGRLLMENENS